MGTCHLVAVFNADIGQKLTGHNGHKPKRPRPKRPQTETATNRNGHKPKRPQTGKARNWNGHKPKRPQTETATNQNGHKPKRPQTGKATRDDIPIYCKAHVWLLGYRIRTLKWAVERMFSQATLKISNKRKCVVSSYLQNKFCTEMTHDMVLTITVFPQQYQQYMNK